MYRRIRISDAWEGSSLADAQDMRVPRASAECRQLFEAAADAFEEYLDGLEFDELVTDDEDEEH